MTQPLSTLSPHPRLFVRWFVQFNPMFTASALCVLGGVLLVSRALGAGADVGLTAILELYQWLVIGVAALLYRRLRERRPAAILGVIQLVLLVDPTLQLSALATASDTAATACWVVLFALKWRALAWAFRLQLSAGARLVPPVAAALVAIMPNARLLGIDETILPGAIAVGVFALGAAVLLLRPSVRSRQALGEVGVLMLPRLVRAAVAIGVVGVAYQCMNAVLAVGPRALLPALGAVAFVFVLRAQRETHVWTLAALGAALWLAGGSAAFTFVGLPIAAIALLMAARAHAPRVATAAIVTAVAAVALPLIKAGTPLQHSPLLLFAGAAATVALVWILTRRRGWSALPALALLHGRWLAPAMATIAPHGGVQWGAALLATGFVLLPAGVMLHRRLSRVLAIDELARADAKAHAPSSSAAMGTSAIGTSAV